MMDFKEYINSGLIESIGIIDGKLVFDYNNLKPNKDEISTKMGKKEKGVKFVPFASSTDTLNKYKVFSVYSTKGANKSKILKTIKKQTDLEMSNTDYERFIIRTAIFMSAKIVSPNKIDIIILPKTSSKILFDLVDEISSRNPGVSYISQQFTKTKPKEIKIDVDHPKINDNIISKLEIIKQNAIKKDNFEMKKVPSWMRKFIKNFIELTPDKYLRKHLEGKNILIIDDIFTSGTTMGAMGDILNMYSPENLVFATLFK